MVKYSCVSARRRTAPRSKPSKTDKTFLYGGKCDEETRNKKDRPLGGNGYGAVCGGDGGGVFIRFVLFRGENPVGGFEYHMLWAGLFSPVYTVLFGLLGVYEPQPQRGFIHEFGNIVLGCTFGVMLYIDLIFVFRVVDFSRWMILLCYLLLIAFTGARGFIAHRLLRRQYRAGNGLRRLVIIGDGASARECLRRVKKRTRRRLDGHRQRGRIGAQRRAASGLL